MKTTVVKIINTGKIVNIGTNLFGVSLIGIDADNEFVSVSDYDLTKEEKNRLEKICRANIK